MPLCCLLQLSIQAGCRKVTRQVVFNCSSVIQVLKSAQVILSTTFVHSSQACCRAGFLYEISPCAQCFPFPQLLLSETSLCWPRGTSCNWVLESWLNCVGLKQRLDYPKQNIMYFASGMYAADGWSLKVGFLLSLSFYFLLLGQK